MKLPIASGAIESTARRVVNLHSQGPSLFWCCANAEAILLLRSYYKAGRWKMLKRMATSHQECAMTFWQAMLRPDTFHRLCLAFALVWLGTTTTANLILLPNSLDFYQYYMGGVIAQSGEWEALYPDPLPGPNLNAGLPNGSIMHPRQAALAAQRGVRDNEIRFIQPPIMALLYWPRAWLDVKTALWLWTAILILSCWVVAAAAGEVFRMTARQPSIWSGLVVLLFAVSPLALRSVRSSNVSCLVGACIALCFIGLLRGQDFRAAAALMFAVLAKYAAGILAPIGIVLHRRRFIAWLAVLTAALTPTVLITGIEPYHVYVSKILPTMAQLNSWRGNNTLSASLARVMGGPEAIPTVEPIMKIVRLCAFVLFVGVGSLIFKRRELIRSSPRHAAAACVALLAWWPLVSPLFWAHYHVYFVPFWGWLVAEALRSRARMIVVSLVIGSMWMALSGMPLIVLKEP